MLGGQMAVITTTACWSSEARPRCTSGSEQGERQALAGGAFAWGIVLVLYAFSRKQRRVDEQAHHLRLKTLLPDGKAVSGLVMLSDGPVIYLLPLLHR